MAEKTTTFSTPEGILDVLWRDGYHAAARLIEKLQTTISKEAELNYLRKAANESCFNSEEARNQLRSLWTAYCFHQNLDVDTAEYDSTLLYLWNEIDKNVPCAVGDADWSDFDHFDLFMGEELA